MDIRTATQGETLTVRLRGELDHHEARGTMQRLDGLIESSFPRELYLDLSELGFMDSSGIAVLLRLYKQMGETGGRMRVIRPSAQALKVIDAAGLDRLIPVDTEEKETAP